MIRGWSTIPTRSFRPIGCPASPFEWKRFRPIWIPSKRKNFPPRKMRTPRISSTTRLSKNCPRRDSFPKEFGRKILSKNSSMMALETARKSVSIHRSCKTKVLFCMVLCLKLLQVEAAPGAEKFRIASGGFGTAIHAVLWAAYHKNIFQKYDLDAEYIAMQSGTTAMQMLLAGELQSLFSGGPQPINANLQGADVTIIAGGLDFFPYKLICSSRHQGRESAQRQEPGNYELWLGHRTGHAHGTGKAWGESQTGNDPSGGGKFNALCGAPGRIDPGYGDVRTTGNHDGQKSWDEFAHRYGPGWSYFPDQLLYGEAQLSGNESYQDH